MTPEERAKKLVARGEEDAPPLSVRIATAIREAVADEREACAQAADKRADAAYERFAVLGHDHEGRDMIEHLEAIAIAAAIRARGDVTPPSLPR